MSTTDIILHVQSYILILERFPSLSDWCSQDPSTSPIRPHLAIKPWMINPYPWWKVWNYRWSLRSFPIQTTPWFSLQWVSSWWTCQWLWDVVCRITDRGVPCCKNTSIMFSSSVCACLLSSHRGLGAAVSLWNVSSSTARGCWSRDRLCCALAQRTPLSLVSHGAVHPNRDLHLALQAVSPASDTHTWLWHGRNYCSCTAFVPRIWFLGFFLLAFPSSLAGEDYIGGSIKW